MNRFHEGWLDHTEYLQKRTPLTVRQANILARWKAGQSLDEISEGLCIPGDRVEDQWTDILSEWERAQEFCTVMGPHPWGDGETRETDSPDDTTWNLIASASMNYSDEERTRIVLELYHGLFQIWDNTYLLVEREIKDSEDYATKTIEERGAYGPGGLRDRLYDAADTLDEYYLRYMLLHKGGIDPSADSATHPETVLNREISQHEAEDARERAREQVTRHSVD